MLCSLSQRRKLISCCLVFNISTNFIRLYLINSFIYATIFYCTFQTKFRSKGNNTKILNNTVVCTYNSMTIPRYWTFFHYFCGPNHDYLQHHVFLIDDWRFWSFGRSSLLFFLRILGLRRQTL